MTRISKDEAVHLLDELAILIAAQIPGFEIRYKTDYKLQKLIGFIFKWILPINRKYMTSYTTTLYPHVYFPNRERVEANPWHYFKVLAHEFVHLYDAKREGSFRFSFKYLAHHSVTVTVLAALTVAGAVMHVSPWWYFFWAASLLPLPAPWRTGYEMRGYAMGLLVDLWRYGEIRQETRDWIADKFTGPDYGWMWPFKANIMRRIERVEDKVYPNNVRARTSNNPYSVVLRLLEENWKAEEAA